MSVEDVLESFSEEQGWNKKTQSSLLLQFLEKLTKEDKSVEQKLTVFLAGVQETENAPLLEAPFLGDELRFFLQTVNKHSKGKATIADAQEVLSETSPEQLAATMESHLIQENGVDTLDELDLEAIYDDVAQELDSFEVSLGDDYLVCEMLNPKKKP